MASEDVSNAPPGRSYILHDLRLDQPGLQRDLIPKGRPLRISSQDWPPDILFDTVYATAVMFIWGAGSNFKDHITPGWKKKFYGESPVDKHDGGKSKMEERTQAAQRREQQSESRAKRYNLRSGRQTTDEPDILDMLLTAQYLRSCRTPSVKTEQDTSEPVRSKVQEWLATSQEFET